LRKELGSAMGRKGLGIFADVRFFMGGKVSVQSD
jgi:hypothetical protein